MRVMRSISARVYVIVFVAALLRTRTFDPARSAVIKTARQLAHDDHIRAFHQLILQRRRLNQRFIRSHRTKIAHRRPSSCESRAALSPDVSPAARCRIPEDLPRPSTSRRLPQPAWQSPPGTESRSYESRCRPAMPSRWISLCLNFWQTCSNTRTASRVTSVPMPSPGTISTFRSIS